MHEGLGSRGFGTRVLDFWFRCCGIRVQGLGFRACDGEHEGLGV